MLHFSKCSLKGFALAVSLFISIYSFAQKEKVIQVAAESMRNMVRDEQQVVRYLGNVKLLHEGAIMNCDSAYLIRKANVVEAYGQIIVTKEDTKLYGDYLYYDGNTSLGRVTGKEVKLIQKDATLITNAINFNTKDNSAYFLTSGVLTNPDNKLESKRGYYFSRDKKYNFAGDVKMEGKDGSIFTDSLEYSMADEIAYFFGPTRIYNKEYYVYCEKGWYNKKGKQSNFLNNALIEKGGQKLYGQDIFYDELVGFAKLTGQVALVDTTRKVTIYGGKGNYWDKKKTGEIVDNPLLLMKAEDDTLFLRADKFFLNSIPSKNNPDSSDRIIKAISEVRFFKKDLQGTCDSLFYNTKDSTIRLISKPILWNDNNQITADSVSAFLGEGNKIRRMDFNGSAFITSKEEDVKFNQIRGKKMVSTFVEGKLAKLDVTGNGQVVYFLRDEGLITAVNKSESTNLVARLKNGKISKISFMIKPVSTFYPIKKVDYEEITLKGFQWLDEKRPRDKFSIIPKGLDLVLTDSKPWFRHDIVSKNNLQQ